MNDNNPSFGSGSNLLGGGGPYVSQQMQNNAPALSQSSPASPSFIPQMQMQPMNMPNRSAALMPQNQQPPQPSGAAALQKLPKNEGQLIVEALLKRLQHITDLEKRLHGG